MIYVSTSFLTLKKENVTENAVMWRHYDAINIHLKYHNQAELTTAKICAKFHWKCFINKKSYSGGQILPPFSDWESSKKPRLDRVKA